MLQQRRLRSRHAVQAGQLHRQRATRRVSFDPTRLHVSDLQDPPLCLLACFAPCIACFWLMQSACGDPHRSRLLRSWLLCARRWRPRRWSWRRSARRARRWRTSCCGCTSSHNRAPDGIGEPAAVTPAGACMRRDTMTPFALSRSLEAALKQAAAGKGSQTLSARDLRKGLKGSGQSNHARPPTWAGATWP